MEKSPAKALVAGGCGTQKGRGGEEGRKEEKEGPHALNGRRREFD